jgi:hypothetical protein
MARVVPAWSATSLRSQIGRLDACDETLTVIADDVVELTGQLQRFRDEAERLERLLAERDAALAEKDRELSRLADAGATARRDADRSSGALREVTALVAAHEAHIAALERELDASTADIAAQEARLADLQAELERSRSMSAAEQERERPHGHVRFLGLPDRYRLLMSDEPCARVGDVVEIEGMSFRVDRISTSPLPADDRPCAHLTLS